MKRSATIIAVGLLIGAITVLPIAATPATLRVGGLFFLTLTVLVGLHVVTGLTKVISLCHVTFVGVGAYGAAIVSLRWGFAPAAAIFTGTVAAAICSLLLALLTTRLEEHYLALGTLAAGEILLNVFRGATALTGGANGLAGVPPLRFLDLVLDTPAEYYPFCLLIGVGALAFAWRLENSNLGRSLRAMGDEGVLVESIGVSSTRLRATGFTIGGALAGLAGAVSAHVDGFVGPETYGVALSIGYLCFLVIGGLGKLQGVLLGAALASLGPEIFRDMLEWQMVVVALLSLGFLVFRARRMSNGRASDFAWLSGHDRAGGRT